MVRTVKQRKASKGTKAWDIECVGNHNFLAGNALFVAHNTNNPEYQKLVGDQTMEALRDRTHRIDIPYNLSWANEISILEQDYNPSKVRQHIAPHTIEIAALWAVLTRLKPDKQNKVGVVDKVKLYDGRALPGFNEDSVHELRQQFHDEGFGGVSARFVQDKISCCLSSNFQYINPFMVMNEIRSSLVGAKSSLISNKDENAALIACVDLALKELDEILKGEVQRALVGDEDAIVRLHTNYIDNVMAYIGKAKVTNPITQREQEPDERLMRSIESKIEVPEQGTDDFRRQLATFIGSMSHSGKVFRWDSNPMLKKALELKLFEDTKDHIKLSALSGAVSAVDPAMQAKIDALKDRLVKMFGYNEKSATDVLDYVGSIFARGDAVEN